LTKEKFEYYKKYFKIENSYESGTQISVEGKHFSEEIFFFDTPGFSDNRGVT
jgi:hypothetical protein